METRVPFCVGGNKKSFQIERRNIQISHPKTCHNFDGERYESRSAIFALGKDCSKDKRGERQPLEELSKYQPL